MIKRVKSTTRPQRKAKTRKPTVVVVIPYYNGSLWIERAIKSVVTQTVLPDEFIVVNDGSKPSERKFLEEIAKKYKFRIIDKKNGGQGSARNAGVAASKSEYISFLDQDDFYLPDHIKDLMTGISKDPRFGFVYADLCEADEDGGIIHSNMLRQPQYARPRYQHVIDFLTHDLLILPSASLIRRCAFESAGGFDEQFTGYEDDDLFLRIFRAGYVYHFIDKPVTVWCIRRDSTSYSILMSRSRFKFFKKLSLLYKDESKRGLFFFRDCLMQRFGHHFIIEAINGVKDNTCYRKELAEILLEYSSMVSANAHVSKLTKKRLKFIASMILLCPRWILLSTVKFMPYSLKRKLMTLK